MKYALVDGQRQEAQPDCLGICPACNSSMVARCGDVRVHHWAHSGRRECDDWYEGETEWHRNWKDQFPANWQEVVHPAENGERHIADVKTDQGWVLEFQHSKIHSDERKAREAFYQKLVWVVDGARRKRDRSQFFKVLEDRMPVVKELSLFSIPFSDEYALLRDWTGSNAPVLFDFSGSDKPDPYLWCFIKVVNGMAYVGPLSREDFIKYHSPEAKTNNRDFSELWGHINTAIEIINQPRQVRTVDPLAALLQERPLMRRRL